MTISKTYFNINFLIFILILPISLLGYIPTFPYWLYNISIYVTIPLFLFLILFKKRISVSQNELLFLVIYITAILISFLFSPFSLSFSGILRAVSPIFSYYLVRQLGIRKNNGYYIILYILLVISFLFALYQFLFQPLYEIEQGGLWVIRADDVLPILKRPVSYLGNANVFGIFTVLTYLILLEFRNKLPKLHKITIFFLCIVNIILFSKSRTSMTAFVLVILLFDIYRGKYIKVASIFLLLIIIIGFILINFNNFEYLDDLFRLSALSETEDNSFTIRKRIAEFAMNLIYQRPIFGVGVGNEFLLMQSTNAPHKGMESATMLLLIERGVFGYIIYLFVLFYKFLTAKKNITKVLIGVVFISVDFTETVCVLPQLTSFIAIYLAVTENSLNLSLPSKKTWNVI